MDSLYTSFLEKGACAGVRADADLVPFSYSV